jgi:hypothetical protein
VRINTYKKTLYNRTVLPDKELEFLNSLSNKAPRLKALHEVGWSLSILGNSLSPKKSKATVHNWIKDASDALTTPTLPTPAPPPLPAHSLAPLVPLYISPELQRLAPLAQKYRSRTPSASIYAESNEKLTELAVSLYLRGVPISAIAQAANVSDRAMYRRVSKGLGKI